MPEAVSSISRRGFLGHVVGAYTATALVANVGALASPVDVLFDRQAALLEALGDADEACIAAGSDAASNHRVARAGAAYSDALREFLAYRPKTLEEAQRKFALLYQPGGPFNGCEPTEGEVSLVCESMMPEVA